MRRHPRTEVPGLSYSDKVAQKNHHHLNHQHTQIHGLQDELRSCLDENRELTRRVSELSKIRQNLKDKIGQMEKRETILLKNTNGHKVTELIGFMDKQRNVYRSNVKQLLDKLDPDRRALEELEEENDDNLENMILASGPSSTIPLKNCEKQNFNPQIQVKIIKATSAASKKISEKQPKNVSYSPSAYKSCSDKSSENGFQVYGENQIQDLNNQVEELNREKLDFEARLTSENTILKRQIFELEQRIVEMTALAEESSRKINRTVSKIAKIILYMQCDSSIFE
jgi:hypothetical protein